MYKEMMASQFETIGKKAYPILTVKSEDAVSVANKFVSESTLPIDVVFFDLAGTVNTPGILTATVNMDYLFCPITSDRLVMKSSLVYATSLQEFLKKNPKAPLKKIFLFWNMIVKSENRELYDAYTAIISKLNLNLLQTEIPFTVKYKREMTISSRQVFRSTLFPPDKALLRGSNLDTLMNEISKIINI
jgi:cellulose biosynthesis protein BcsQ